MTLEKVGECPECEGGIIVKDTLGPFGTEWIEVRPDGTKLPQRQMFMTYCNTCGTHFHLQTILKNQATNKHA